MGKGKRKREGKGKGKLARIEDEEKRTACMRKRSAELVKMVEELSTTTGVDSAIVVYDGATNGEPVAVWPPNPTKVLERYMALPEAERTENAIDMESYLIEKIKEMEIKCEELDAKHKKLEFAWLMQEAHYG
ncbi:Agamous-like MADS-box protein AGL92, partial [Linum grandiflorum]